VLVQRRTGEEEERTRLDDDEDEKTFARLSRSLCAWLLARLVYDMLL